MDSALANNSAKGNGQRGPQDCSGKQRQAPMWFNITTVPATREGREGLALDREKAAVKLFQNRDPVMKMVRDFKKSAESVGHQSLTKEAAKYVDEYGQQLKLQYPDPACVSEDVEVIPREKLKSQQRKQRELRLEGDVGAKKWQGKLVKAREGDEELSSERYFWWLSEW